MTMGSTEFAKAIGVSVATLYNWESRGILVPVRKTPSGRRVYSEKQVQVYLNEDFDNPVLTRKIGDNSVLRE